MENLIEIPILIAGGGPVGLALALDLDHMCTQSLVVEQDAGTALVMLAKAGTHSERTLEFCRRWGLVDQIAGNFPEDLPRDTVYCTTLGGKLIGRSAVSSARKREVPLTSPEMMRRCAQNQFDPILADAVLASSHARLRYNCHFESFTQDDTGVTSILTDLLSGNRLTVRSQYLVACDGAGSKIRQSLDIPFDLIQQMDYSLSAMLRIKNIERFHSFGACERFMFIDSKGTWANMTSVDGKDLWRFTVVGSETALDPATYDISSVVERALGGSGATYSIERLVPWRRAQTLARTYSRGRVLLAGDSAHTTSPTGGHGLGTGIGDITDVSWILNALTEGWGGPQLLEAYTRERRPVAVRNLGNSTQNYHAWVAGGMDNVTREGPEGDTARRNIGSAMAVALHQEWFSQGIALGYNYSESPIVVGDGTTPPQDHPSFYVPTARPGHRAPHAWLNDGRSTLDLFGKGFVLLCFDDCADQLQPFHRAALETGLPLKAAYVDQPEIASLYERRLVLVRPDGQVAWRGDTPPADVVDLFNIVRGASTKTKLGINASEQ